MRNILILFAVASLFFSSCKTNAPISKSVAYKGMYGEKPLTILLMPPINRSTNVEAKEYFHATLSVPIVNAGYYVIPTFLSMEMLKKESAWDSELFLEAPLTTFGEVFGADLALFTIIHKWNKSSLAAKVNVKVEYIIKSIKTNEVVFKRIGDVTYDASVSTGAQGIGGLVANVALSAVNTAAVKYVSVARVCNKYTLDDLPEGQYSPLYGKDGEELAAPKSFKVKLNSSYR